MSTTLVGAVLNHGPENGPLSHALVAIADNADDHGLAWPSLETIALKSRCDVRTAIRRVQALEKAGWVTVYRRAKGKYSVYVIDIQKLGVTLNAKSRRSGFWDDLERTLKARSSKKGTLKFASRKISHDKMSLQNQLDLDISSDTSGNSEVTTTVISHDTSGKSLKVLNRKEPSRNLKTPLPPEIGGGEISRISAGVEASKNGVTPTAKLEAQLLWATARVMRAHSFTPDRRIEEAICEALRLHCSKSRCTPEEAVALEAKNMHMWNKQVDLMRHPWGKNWWFKQGNWCKPNAWPYDQQKLDRMRDASVGMANE